MVPRSGQSGPRDLWRSDFWNIYMAPDVFLRDRPDRLLRTSPSGPLIGGKGNRRVPAVHWLPYRSLLI